MGRPDRDAKLLGEVSEGSVFSPSQSFEFGYFLPCQIPQWWSAKYLPVCASIRQSGLHSFCDERALKLRYRTDHLKHKFTGWQRSIHCFCHRNEINSQGPAQFQPGDQRIETSGESVKFPDHDDIHRSSPTVSQDFVQCWPFPSCSRVTPVAIDLLYFPGSPLDVIPQSSLLRFRVLLTRAHSCVECGPLRLHSR